MATHGSDSIFGAAHRLLGALLFGAIIALATMPAGAHAASTGRAFARGSSVAGHATSMNRSASTARSSSARGRRRAGRRRKRCPRGYRKVRVRQRHIACKRRNPASPADTASPTGDDKASDPQTSDDGQSNVVDLQQQIVDDTFELTQKFGEEVIHSNSGTLPYTYKYLIHPEDCVTVSGDTGRCLIYLWTQEYATGYGYGGYDVGIYRDYFIATRVGDRLYSTKVVMVDFLDPYMWACSDTPRYNTPRCT